MASSLSPRPNQRQLHFMAVHTSFEHFLLQAPRCVPHLTEAEQRAWARYSAKHHVGFINDRTVFKLIRSKIRRKYPKLFTPTEQRQIIRAYRTRDRLWAWVGRLAVLAILFIIVYLEYLGCLRPH